MTDIDIHIRNARLRRRADDARFDIAIANGRIVAIEPSLDVRAREEIDAGGNLVTTSYVDPHLHLCKVWTLPMMEEAALKAYRGGGMAHTRDAIDLASKVKESTTRPGSPPMPAAQWRSPRSMATCISAPSPTWTTRRGSRV
jgi:imidazolonepropionase-like amidohydrolase